MAKVHYPDTYKDFSENSFGSFILDAVSYVGDQLSFYLDYQVNETFLETAIEYDNIKRMAENYGYTYAPRPAAFGMAVFYVLVPASSTGLGPDPRYIPVLRTGTEVQSQTNINFVLTEDVDFNHPKNSVVAARFSASSGKPTQYAIRAFGQIKSSLRYRTTVPVGDFTKFRRVRVGPGSIIDVVSVFDSEGHEYFKVENLTQDIIHEETVNPNVKSDGVRSILKPKAVKRRFVVVQDSSGTYLQFGSGSDEEVTTVDHLDPSQVALQMSGRDYISDDQFDPTKLLYSDSLGICPSNTTLTVIYEKNAADSINLSSNSITRMANRILTFPNRTATSDITVENAVTNSLEVSNEKPIVGNTSIPTAEEVKIRSYSAFASQSRIVTKNDYETYCYHMPAKFGSVKRANVVSDPSFTDKVIDIYVISTDGANNLVTTNDTIKVNLKTWLNRNCSINDRINIKNAIICNIGFEYVITVDPKRNKTSVINAVNSKLREHLADKFYIGESFYISNLYYTINKVSGVVDVKDVTMKLPSSNSLTQPNVTIDQMMSKDGTRLDPPKNVIFELKEFNNVVTGIAL